MSVFVALALTESCRIPASAWADALAQYGAAQSASSPASGAPNFLVFGGEGHKTFLGCFCSQYAQGSLFNAYGYGNKFSATSIFNHFSIYGSPYSPYSACNPYANDPPVVVTQSGQFVGRLTLNRYVPGALNAPQAVTWLTSVCTST